LLEALQRLETFLSSFPAWWAVCVVPCAGQIFCALTITMHRKALEKALAWRVPMCSVFDERGIVASYRGAWGQLDTQHYQRPQSAFCMSAFMISRLISHF
jgi:hypothetical protein